MTVSLSAYRENRRGFIQIVSDITDFERPVVQLLLQEFDVTERYTGPSSSLWVGYSQHFEPTPLGEKPPEYEVVVTAYPPTDKITFEYRRRTRSFEEVLRNVEML